MNLNRQPQKGQNPPINATGEEQAQAASAHLDRLLKGSSIDAVFYSPLTRARQTMEILMASRPTPRISEPAQGLKQGCYVDDVRDFVTYSYKRIDELDLQNVLVVSHGPVIKYMFQWLYESGELEHASAGRFHTPRNASIAEIEIIERNKYILRRYDELD